MLQNCTIKDNIPCVLLLLQYHSIQKDWQPQKQLQVHWCVPYPPWGKHQQHLQSSEAQTMQNSITLSKGNEYKYSQMLHKEKEKYRFLKGHITRMLEMNLSHARIIKITRVCTCTSNNKFWPKKNSCFLKHLRIYKAWSKWKETLTSTVVFRRRK